MVDLLVHFVCFSWFLYWKYYLHFYKTGYLNEEVNCTDPSPSISVPCLFQYGISYGSKYFYSTGPTHILFHKLVIFFKMGYYFLFKLPNNWQDQFCLAASDLALQYVWQPFTIWWRGKNCTAIQCTNKEMGFVLKHERFMDFHSKLVCFPKASESDNQ